MSSDSSDDSTAKLPPAVLVVDDDEPAVRSIARTLRPEIAHEIISCSDSRNVLGILDERDVDVVLLDLMMPHVTGEELLGEIVTRHPHIAVIMVTGEDDVATAVRCMKRGATDYLVKPVDPDTLIVTVRRALEQAALKYEAVQLRQGFLDESPEASPHFDGIVTADPGMRRMFAYLEAVSRGSQPVLITGETGTGKELIARAVHKASQRSGPFIAVNVAGLDAAAFSDSIFGHEEGAYTGAVGERKGLIEEAGSGTLFLDEIGDLAEESQVKLLRVLQEREYYRLGSDVARPMRARVVAATHQDPEKLRPDLYYRLRLYHARVPPLRERLGDLPLLVERFVADAAADLGKATPKVPAELFVHLETCAFPGNVRELQAMAFDAVARCTGSELPVELFQTGEKSPPVPNEPAGGLRLPFPMPVLQQLEREAIAEALRRVQGNQSAAARMLGVSRATIARKLSD